MKFVRLDPDALDAVRVPSWPLAHLDALEASVHVGAVDDGRVVAWLSALHTDWDGVHEPVRWVVGQPAEHECALVEALLNVLPPGALLRSHRPLAGFEADDPVWVLRVPAGSKGEPKQDGPSRRVPTLAGIESVRKRPGMYVGGTGEAGVANLLQELVSNTLDEHLAGHATELEIDRDGDTWRVRDDGRGIPPRALEVVLHRLHTGNSWDGHRPHVHTTLYGLGLAAVSALSERLVVLSNHEGRRWQKVMVRGLPSGPLRDLGPTDRVGTEIQLVPDRAIFGEVGAVFSLYERLKLVAFAVPGLRVRLDGLDLSQPSGLDSLIRTLGVPLDAELRRASAEHEGIRVELVTAWGEGPAWHLAQRWICNMLELTTAGSPDDAAFSLLEGTNCLAVVGNLLVQDPRYRGRTKDRLEMPEAAEAVRIALERVIESA